MLGGDGFVDWYPFDHPQLGRVEIGGWDFFRTWTNAPPALMEAEVAPHSAWAVAQLLASPRLGVRSFAADPIGDGVWRVRLVVENTGWLPTNVTRKALDRKAVRPVEAELVLPDGASIALGDARQELGQLAGHGRARQMLAMFDGGFDPTDDRAKAEWIVHARSGHHGERDRAPRPGRHDPRRAHPSVSTPLSVGLAGAGPWARTVHAPTLAAGPETQLAGVWSRTEASAEALSAAHGVPAFGSFAELLDHCEAVAIAVPPTAQPDLAVQAARAGKALLLEKPLGLDVAGAERIAEAVADAGVGSVMVLTYRFAPRSASSSTRRRASRRPAGGRASSPARSSVARTPSSQWRVEHGLLIDVGPHIIDLVDAALGPTVGVRAHGDVHEWVGLLLEHESGAVSEVSISCKAAITPSRTEVEIFGPQGSLAVDGRADSRDLVFANLRRDFATVARTGGPHPCDAARGLHLQHLITAATAALAGAT